MSPTEERKLSERRLKSQENEQFNRLRAYPQLTECNVRYPASYPARWAEGQLEPLKPAVQLLFTTTQKGPASFTLHLLLDSGDSQVQYKQGSMAIVSVAFHLFPDLPAELRRKIWAAAIIPRLIQPQLIRQERAVDSTRVWYKCSLPALLQTCHESRDEFLLQYHRRPLVGGAHLGPPVYLKPLTDVLYVSRESCTSPQGILHSSPSLSEPGSSQRTFTAWEGLRAVAFCTSSLWLIGPMSSRFPSLEVVYLVQNPEKNRCPHVQKRMVEEQLERRTEWRGNWRVRPGLSVEVVTWEELRRRAPEESSGLGEKDVGSAPQCRLCLLTP